MTVAVVAARTITVTVTSPRQEINVLSVAMIMQVGHVIGIVKDSAMMMALILPLMMHNFNVFPVQTRSPNQYCHAPVILLKGRLRHHGLVVPLP